MTLAVCPFCGCCGACLFITSPGMDCYFVQCECGASGPSAENTREAKTEWNRRASPATETENT